MKSDKMRVISRLLLVTFFLLTTSSNLLFREMPVAAEDGPGKTQVVPEIRDGVAALVSSGATVSYHAQTGRVNFISTGIDNSIAAPTALAAGATRDDAARGFLSRYGSVFGLVDQRSELIPMAAKELERGRAKVRFQQVYNNIPIFGGELIVQLDSHNSVTAAIGEVLPEISLSTEPTISAEIAAETALAMTAKWHEGIAVSDLTVTELELWIYNPMLVGPDKGPTVLVWRMEVSSSIVYPVRELVLLNAHEGSVALHFNQIEEARNRLTYMTPNDNILPGPTLVCTESNPTCSGGNVHAVGAHVNAGATYDYYMSNFGRDSINGAGMPLISSIFYGQNYDNAYWDGAQMVYGDAYGFANADDVVGHELTHGVVDYEADLYYYYQSGAMNESFADVFGEFVDLTNGTGNDSAGERWYLGEDVTGYGALRNMKHPPEFGDPDKMTSSLYYKTAGDAGGVHHNSGINNKAAYLIVDGGTFNGRTVSGIGIPKASQIYYEVLTNLLTAGSDYADLYNALYQGCQNLIGTEGITMTDCQQVRLATQAVEMNLQPVAGFNTDAPVCDVGSDLDTTLFFDNMEAGIGNWVFGAEAGSSRWRYDAPLPTPTLGSRSFPHSGLHFLYADDRNSSTSDSFAAMKNGVSLPAGAYLHFSHAYGFEGPAYDGGVLEYTPNNGINWIRINTFEYNGYDGNIANFGNLLAGQAAWLDDSHGYISSRVNLSFLANQTVRFRWRMSLDSSYSDRGWWLDDVGIYTCASPMPPANDNIDEATTITTVPYTINQSTANATFEGNEPAPSCGATMDSTVWYTYTASITSTLSLSTSGSDFDTMVGVWTRDGLGTMTEVECSDDDIDSTSLLYFNIVAGTKYYIQIGGYQGQVGSLTLNVKVPPANDLFDNAISITNVPYSNAQSTVSALVEYYEETPSCAMQIASTVWYEYTAASDGDLVFNSAGSNYNTVLAVWTGTLLTNLTEVGCRNYDTMAVGAPVTVSVVTGTTYYIQIGALTNAGTLQFTVTVPPTNDAFLNATAVPEIPFNTTQSTLNATLELGEQVSAACPNAKGTVWYSYTPVESGSILVSTAGSNYDTTIAVWTGSTLANLTESVCNNDEAGQTSLFTLSAAAGTTYYIQIGGHNGAAGNLSLSVEETTGPGNDNFSSALTIGALPFTTTQSNIGATVEGAEQLPSCAPNMESTVWYTYVAVANGPVTVNTGGSIFNTALAVWSGTTLGGLTQVACNDNSGIQVSQVAFNAVASTRYYIQIGGVTGGTGPSGSVLNLAAAVQPANDVFTSALPITALPYSHNENTFGAWQDTGEATSICSSPIGATVWFKYTAPASKTVTFSTVGSNYDTVLAVWTGPNVAALTNVGCNNGAGNGSVVSANTASPTTYYIMVAGANAASGDLVFQAYLNNDYFSNALSTGTLIVGLPYTRSQSTIDTTVEAGEKPGNCGLPVTNTVWYKYTSPAKGSVMFSTTGSGFNTVISVWTGTTLANLVQVACNDDGLTPPTSSVTVNTVAAGTYYIRLGGNNGANGSLTFKADLVPAVNAAPPRNYYTTATPTLTWNRITWATAYEIQVDDASTFPTTPALTFTTIVSGDTLSVTTPPLPRGQYFWRVRAKNSSNVPGAWSIVDSFLVDVP